jgi:hypothetical protein
MSIKPDYLTLDSLLQKRLFRIPDYQRAYSWETKQREDLFGDIRKLEPYKDRHHFMATIVCLNTNERKEVGADEFGVFNIVDGQQRLTTLIILLKALAKALSTSEDDDEKIEAKKLNELLVKRDKRLILLQTNHDSSLIFYNYLKCRTIPDEKTVKTLAERNLVRAINECESFAQGWDKGPLSLLKIIKNRLDFIFYVLEDEGSVYTIFEVLNSRGLDVDWLDKCKSMLMGIAFEKLKPDVGAEYIKELHKCWTNIYRTIGLRKVPGHEILRFAATLKHPELQNRIVTAENAMEFFRDYCEQNPIAVLEVSQEFLRIAEKLEQLYENPRLRAVTDIIQARLLAVAIMLNESLNGQEQKQVLEQWERVTFRIFGLFRKDARTKVGDYARLSYRVHNSKMSSKDIIAEIISLGGDHPISEAIRQLHGEDCYDGWENDLRYFFYRYEEYLAGRQGSTISKEIWEQIWRVSPTRTVEHIHPRNPSPAWRGKLGRRNDQFEKNVNRLGNLMLLPPDINSQAGARSFKEKKSIYKKNYLRLMDEILAEPDWNKKTIEEREKRLLAWAEGTWG